MSPSPPDSPSMSQSPNQPATASRRKTKSKKKNNKQIPRPKNAWILYRIDKQKTVHIPSDNGNPPTQGKVSQVIAGMWNKETPEVRAHYERLAEMGKLAHQRDNPGYKYNPVKKEVKAAQKAQMKAEAKAKKDQERAAKSSRGRQATPPELVTPPVPAPAPTADAASLMPDLRYGPGGPSPPMSAASSPEPVPYMQLSDDNPPETLSYSPPLRLTSVSQAPSRHEDESSSRSSSEEYLPTPDYSPEYAATRWNTQTTPMTEAGHHSYLSGYENNSSVSFDIPDTAAVNMQMFDQGLHMSGMFSIGNFDPITLGGPVEVAFGDYNDVQMGTLPTASYDPLFQAEYEQSASQSSQHQYLSDMYGNLESSSQLINNNAYQSQNSLLLGHASATDASNHNGGGHQHAIYSPPTSSSSSRNFSFGSYTPVDYVNTGHSMGGTPSEQVYSPPMPQRATSYSQQPTGNTVPNTASPPYIPPGGAIYSATRRVAASWKSSSFAESQHSPPSNSRHRELSTAPA